MLVTDAYAIIMQVTNQMNPMLRRAAQHTVRLGTVAGAVVAGTLWLERAAALAKPT